MSMSIGLESIGPLSPDRESYPRPLQNPLPIWVGVGGTPESFARAGMLGLPLMVAIIGGEPHRFRPLVDLYREAGRRAGHARKLKVGIHSLGYVANTTEEAADDFFPGYAKAFTEIGKERGWPPTTRAQFDAVRGPKGALLLGDAKTVAEKLLYLNEALGGVSRVTFQMSVATLDHAKVVHAIEMLGGQVAPLVSKALGTLPRLCRCGNSLRALFSVGGASSGEKLKAHKNHLRPIEFDPALSRGLAFPGIPPLPPAKGSSCPLKPFGSVFS